MQTHRNEEEHHQENWKAKATPRMVADKKMRIIVAMTIRRHLRLGDPEFSSCTKEDFNMKIHILFGLCRKFIYS